MARSARKESIRRFSQMSADDGTAMTCICGYLCSSVDEFFLVRASCEIALLKRGQIIHAGVLTARPPLRLCVSAVQFS